MFDRLFDQINALTTFTNADRARCESFFTAHTLQKRQFLLHPGEACQHLAFVSTGCNIRVHPATPRR